MGVDFYSCSNCSETFPDCGDYVSCDCGVHWCNDKCACDEGIQEEDDCTTCSYCRKEEVDDYLLVQFLLKQCGTTREEAVKKYYEKKKRRKKVVDQKDLNELDDASFPLKKWQSVIRSYIEKYGDKAVLSTDAGHNNVEFKLELK